MEEKIEKKNDDKGKKELVEIKTTTEEFEEKSFLNRISDLLDALMNVEGYKDHVGLTAFSKVISSIERKEGDQRKNLEDNMKNMFEKFYNRHGAEFKEEKLEFLTTNDEEKKENIVFGSSGKAFIPLSTIYTEMCESNPELIDTIEGCIYFVLQHVCPDNDLDDIIEICKEFEPETHNEGGGFIDLIGNIVGRVSDKLEGNDSINLEDKDGKFNTNAIGTVVQDLIGDEVIQGSIKNMMSNITSDDFDINSVFDGLMNTNRSK